MPGDVGEAERLTRYGRARLFEEKHTRLMRAFGMALRELMASFGVPRKELARRLGVDVARVDDVLYGTERPASADGKMRNGISLAKAYDFAEALEMSLSTVISRAEEILEVQQQHAGK